MFVTSSHIFSPVFSQQVELQPDHSIGFQDAHGYANLARMMGLHYRRYEAADGLTSKVGTRVDVGAIRALVTQAVDLVRNTPTCLHDTKDTTYPIY